MSETQHRWTVADLLQAEFAPLVWYVERIITSGVTLLWGSPKSGKSIAALHLLVAIAAGGKALGTLGTEHADCLYISLEDGPRRLQKRLQAVDAPWMQSLEIFTKWTRGSKGIEQLEKHLDEHPTIKVVVVDTFVLFTKTRDSSDYSETTDYMEQFKVLAEERDLAIVVIHHSRKVAQGKEDVDFAETALGSTGMTSGPDHLLYLQRTPKGQTDAVLHFRSKDADGAELALNFDHDIQGWRFVGDASEMAKTAERQEIYDFLVEAQEAKGPKAIADALKKNVNTTKTLLRRMVDEGMVQSMSGLYTPCKPVNSVNSVNPEKDTEQDGFTQTTEFTGLKGGKPTLQPEPPAFNLADRVHAAQLREVEAYSEEEPDPEELIEDAVADPVTEATNKADEGGEDAEYPLF